jgi:hypothetical protein
VAENAGDHVPGQDTAAGIAAKGNPVKALDSAIEASLVQAKEQVLRGHGSDPNVTGVGVGYRFRGGQWTDEPVVTVLVARKRPEALIARSRLLPRGVRVKRASWGVDVVEAGPFYLHGTSGLSQSAPDAIHDARVALGHRTAREALLSNGFAPLSGKVRPPREGCSISNLADGGSADATLGCFVIDKTDGTVCLLSSNHGIARTNAGVKNQAIIQPGGGDGGATSSDRVAGLKRWVTLADGTQVDGAIAQLDNQSGYTTAVMNNLMSPISQSHPAVAMDVAGDPQGIFNLLTRMDVTLSQLNVRLLNSSSTATEVVAPAVGMNIEKVSRTTGYTSATILGTNFNTKVHAGGSVGVITYDNMIWAMFFGLGGDSGGVACKGGPGNLQLALLFLALLAACPLLDALTTYYAIPLNSSQNNTLADDLRDNFLSQSTTGQLLIQATYANANVVIDRLNTDTGPAHNQSLAQAKAKALYSQYHALAAKLITSKSPTAVVTKSDLSVVASILTGLALPATGGGTGMLTSKEATAAFALYSDVLKPTLGMNRTQLLAYMNKESVFNKVYNQLTAVPTLKFPGRVNPF